MSDTAIFSSNWISEGPDVSENEMRNWMSDISKDLKHSIAAQAQHSQESAVYRERTDGRLKNLEDNVERRSALKGGLTMAGIGAFFGALAAAVGKKTGLWALALVPFVLAGCAFSEADRQSIIAASVQQAGDLAAATVFAKVEAEMLKQGKTAEEAAKIAQEAAGIARASAEAVAGKTAEIATAKASAERSSSAGSWITALLPALLGLVGAAAKKGLGA